MIKNLVDRLSHNHECGFSAEEAEDLYRFIAGLEEEVRMAEDRENVMFLQYKEAAEELRTLKEKFFV